VPGTEIRLTMHQHENRVLSFPVVDAAGAAVDLTGLTLRFVVHTDSNATAGLFEVESGGDITISGTPTKNIAAVRVRETESATARAHVRWSLWDVIAKTILAHGPFSIEPAVFDIP